MFNKNKWLQPWFKLMAKQLSKPTGFFARLTGKKMNETNRQMYEQVFSSMAVEDGDAILEIGFGNGKFFPELYSKAKDLSLSGIELSQEMVTEAIKNNHALVDAGTLKLQTGATNSLPFADNSFDKIFCINVIYFWEDAPAHLQEIKRVLKPGGKFYTGFRPAANMLQIPFTQYGFRLYSEDEWKDVLDKNGFTVEGFTKTTGPEMKIGGRNILLEAVCMVGRK
mgnify:CR=1 FL=1